MANKLARFAPVFLFILQATACSDSSVTGSALHRAELPPVRYSSYASGGQFRIVDAYDGDAFDGLTFTLDTTLQRITASNGDLVHLDGPEQTAMALSAFRAVIEGDGEAQFLSTLSRADIAPIDDCPYDASDPSRGCWAEVRMDDERARDPRARTASSLDRRTRSHRNVKALFRPLEEPRSGNSPRSPDRLIPLPAPDGTPKSPTVLKLHGAMAALTAAEFDKCGDIISAALPQTLHWPPQRTSFVKDLFKSTVTKIVNGVVGKVAPKGTSDAVRFHLSAAEVLQRRIEIGFLHGAWISWRCDRRDDVVATNSITVVTGGQPFPGQRLYCGYEKWEISFDNGDKWYPVTLFVCRWRRPEDAE